MDGLDFAKAAREGDLKILTKITKKEINARGEDGMTPVHWAASYGNLEALRILIGKGGNPDKPNNDGSTAVHLAAGAGQLPSLVFLTNFGANVYAVNDHGNSPLQEAANKGRMDCTRHLEALVTHQMTQDRLRVEKLQQKAKKEAEKRVREKAKLIQKLDREWERKLEKQKRSGATLITPRSFQNGDIPTKVIPRAPETLLSDSESVDRKKTFSELTGLRSDGESTDVESPRSKPLSPDDQQDTISVSTDQGQINRTSRLSDDIVFERRDFARQSDSILSTSQGGQMMKKNGHTSNGHALVVGEKLPSDRSRTILKRASAPSELSQSMISIRSNAIRNRFGEMDRGQYNMATLVTFLNALDLEEFKDTFAKEKIDLRAVSLCSENDLKEIGLPLGPRKKITDALEKRKEVLRMPGSLTESLV